MCTARHVEDQQQTKMVEGLLVVVYDTTMHLIVSSYTHFGVTTTWQLKYIV